MPVEQWPLNQKHNYLDRIFSKFNGTTTSDRLNKTPETNLMSWSVLW